MNFLPSSATRSGLILRLIVIVVFAISLRLVYQAGMLTYGGSFSNGSDSGKYINVATTLLRTGVWARSSNNNDENDGNLSDASNRMPLYIYFLAGTFKFFGTHDLLFFDMDDLRPVVTIQAFLDGVSILGIATAAMALSPQFAIPAALTAAVIPNFLVHASYALQENVFLVFFSWGLCALLWAVRGPRTVLLLTIAGLLFGMALMTRLVVAYYAIFMIPFLVVALRLERHGSWLRCVALALIPLVVIEIVALPLRIDNYLTYGYATLSSQSGAHLMNWLYGCLATSWPCTDRGGIARQFVPIVQAKAAELGVQGNPFAISAIYQQLAIEQILKLPLWQIALGMSWGAFRNLIQTGFYEVLTQFRQPPTFISAIPGANLWEKFGNFLLVNKTNYFMVMWAVSEIFLILSRGFQGYALWHGLMRRELRSLTLLLAATIAYFLLVQGPIGNPKYRFPMEPALIILFAMGIVRSGILAKFASLLDCYRPAGRALAGSATNAKLPHSKVTP